MNDELVEKLTWKVFVVMFFVGLISGMTVGCFADIVILKVFVSVVVQILYLSGYSYYQVKKQVDAYEPNIPEYMPESTPTTKIDWMNQGY